MTSKAILARSKYHNTVPYHLVFNPSISVYAGVRKLHQLGYKGAREPGALSWAETKGVKWAPTQPWEMERRKRPRHNREAGDTQRYRACYVNPERAVWLAVLLQAFGDAYAAPVSDELRLAKQQAINWFGTKDFRIVCELAGVDHNYAIRKYKEQVTYGNRSPAHCHITP